jgi:LysM repeat protein
MAEGLSTKYKIYYRTKDGEDLAEVSERFGVSVDELRLWNALKPTDSLIPGQVVVINKSTTSEKPTVVARTAPRARPEASVAKREDSTAKEPASEEDRSVSTAQAEQERDQAPAEGAVVGETESFQAGGESMAAENEQTTTEVADDSAGEPVGYDLDESVEQIVHTVEMGESLSEIGQDYGISWQVLARQNQITDPEIIYEGQRIKIRRDSAEGAAGPMHEETYIVRAGENLYRIGLKYGIPWEEIARKNNILNETRLLAGQVLKIPTARGGPELAP